MNDPTYDASHGDGTHITQSEVSIASVPGGTVMGFNDTTHLHDGGSSSLTGYAHSADGGATWQDLGELPSAGGESLVLGDPVLDARADGTVFFANLFCTGPGQLRRCPIGVSSSTDGGRTFGPPSLTWPAIPPESFADKPWLVVDRAPASPRAGRVYVAWANFVPTGDASIMLASSADGASWSAPVTISDPTCAPLAGQPHAGQGVQLGVGPNGDVYASWWCFGDTAFQIRFDRSTDGGVTWGTDRLIASFTEPSGDRIVDCGPPGAPRPSLVYLGDIRTNDFPSMAVDPLSGSIHVTWTEDPDGFGAGEDDAAVYYARSTDGGASWSPPTVLGAHPADQFFPVIRSAADGTVVVAWYDRRNDVSNLSIDLYVTTSSNRGLTFGELHRVSTTAFGVPRILPNYDTGVRNCYMGDYNGMLPMPDRAFLLGWGDNRDPGPPENNAIDQNIYAATVVVPRGPGGRSGACDITGTPGRDRLRGTSAGETICGRGGPDVLVGLGGDDVLKGGGGPDLLRGGPGNDILKGGGGRDLARAGPGRDRCVAEIERGCER